MINKNNNDMKDSRTSTANNLNIGDKVFFITFDSIHSSNGKLERVIETVTKIEPSKTGKRVSVTFESGRVIDNIGFNTNMQDSSKKFWRELEEERGVSW